MKDKNKKDFCGSREEVIAKGYSPCKNRNPYAASDLDLIRKEIRTLIDACRRNQTPCEILLKDISTSAYNLENLIVWNKIAKEEVER